MNQQVMPIDLAKRGFVVEIEHEVLGGLLRAGTVAPVLGTVKPEHFVEPLHRRIFENMLVAHDRYSSVNLAIVYKFFPESEADDWKKQLGQPLSSYLASVASASVYGVGGLKNSVPNLLSQSARIGLAVEAENIAIAANDAAASPSELIRTATRLFDDIAAGLRGGNKGRTRFTVSEAADTALDETQEAMTRGNGVTGITWGLADANAKTGGIQRREMVVLGARPGMGKTALGLGTAIKAARSGAGVGFISLEMGSNRLAMRALTDIAYDWNLRVPYNDLITGRVSPKDFDGICAAKQDLNLLPLWIEEQSGLTLTDLRVKIERMQDQADRAGHTIDLLIVDYMQLIAASSRYSGNRNNEVSEISAGLRQIARENDMAMLALSQLSRGIESREDKRPMLSDLRDSGSIEQDADTVVFLYREAYYLGREKGKDADAEMERLDKLEQVENKLEFIIAKQRNGPTGTVDLFIDVAASAVRNAARSF